MLGRVLTLSILVLLMASVNLPAAQVTAERSEKGVIVTIDGQPFTEYLVHCGTKPALWPILGPTGVAVTRSYPMAKAPNESTDHVHQRSMWFSHGSVNGLDFWTEAPGKNGTIEHREFVRVESGPEAVIVTRNDWRGPDGKRLCEDQRTLTFGSDGTSRWIDFDITVKATDGPVVFGDTKEGTFGLRVAHTITVDAKQGGRIVNSHGQVDDDAWGKPAAWVDCHGPLEGHTVGIAVLNHPSSFRFPTPWHVRTYGLFAANPFCVRGFGSKGVPDGSFTLASGDSFRLRYRVLLHRGDEKDAKIPEAFARYAKPTAK